MVVLLFSYKYFFSPKQPHLKIAGHKINLEVAKTEADKAQGLSNRAPLPPDTGMLFVYDQPQISAFWMKDMNFALDFIWINNDQVVELTENVQPEDYQPPKSFQPQVPVTSVLEVNSGTVKNLGLQVGDLVEF